MLFRSEAPSQEPRKFELPAGYDGLAEARRLLRSIRAGSLATLDASGAPFASLVNVATAFDGAPLLLMSGLSAHTQYLGRDPRASILLAETGKGDPLAHPRLSLWGTVEAIGRESKKFSPARAAYLLDHPKAQLYVDFPDFLFFKMVVDGASLNGGFGKAYQFTSTEFRKLCADQPV